MIPELCIREFSNDMAQVDTLQVNATTDYMLGSQASLSKFLTQMVSASRFCNSHRFPEFGFIVHPIVHVNRWLPLCRTPNLEKSPTEVKATHQLLIRAPVIWGISLAIWSVLICNVNFSPIHIRALTHLIHSSISTPILSMRFYKGRKGPPGIELRELLNPRMSYFTDITSVSAQPWSWAFWFVVLYTSTTSLSNT